MDLPINPNSPAVPNFTPTGPGPAVFTPLQKLLIDTFAPSIGSILPPPALDPNNPRISAGEFFNAVSQAQLKQMLQDYINRITDPLLRQKLLDEVVVRAGSIADLITLVVQYRELLFRLDQINLTGKQTRLNNAVNAFNSNSSQDISHVNAMNAAISAYSNAQTNYQNALTTYQGALSTFTGAQASYNSALTTWNTALNAYNSGSITQAQLQAAESTFNLAKSNYDAAKVVMGNATTAFDSAKTTWQNEQSDLTAATTTYNNYVASRLGDLDDAALDFNNAIQQALPILADMNAIQATLFGSSPLGTPTTFTGIGLSPFDQGTPDPGPDTLRNQVQGTLDISNGTSSSLNTVIGQIASIIATINGGGYVPPLVAPLTQLPIANLPTANSNYDLDPVIYTAPTSENFNFASLSEFDTSFIDIMLNAVNEYDKTSQLENNFQRQMTDLIIPFAVDDAQAQSTGVGSSVSVSANRVTGGRQSPHLLGTLSKQVFETVLNVRGVPAGSPLVDQLGALVYGYKSVLGLTSAGPAQELLGDNTVPGGAQGKAAVDGAVALGNLSQVQDLVLGGQITIDITRIINADPSLAELTPEAKAALIQSLVQEIGATLIKSALNQLAVSIDLPGLVSQILANLTNILSPESPDTNLEQIVRELTLSQELAKQLNISRSTADSIVQNALRALELKNQAATQDAIIQAIIDQIRADQALNASVSASSAQSNAIAEDNRQAQISADAALEAGVRESVVKADQASAERVDAENRRVNNRKRDAFLDSLAEGLEAFQVDPAKIRRLQDIYRPTILNALIAGLIKPNFLEALTNHLIKLPLSPEEARQVAETALSKATEKDASLNPLSTFIGNHVLGLPELSAIFKSQVANVLSPVVGQAKALDVAENYGRLIFADPNSTMKLLENNERSLALNAGYDYNARVFEDYRNAAQIFINPLNAQDNPLHKGNVLLLSGQAAGLSVQGTTSADNTLGPSGYHNKKPIDMPG